MSAGRRDDRVEADGADEKDAEGLEETDTLAIARALKSELDYLNVIAGTSASAGSFTPAPATHPGRSTPTA